jgi:hypothetical protein
MQEGEGLVAPFGRIVAGQQRQLAARCGEGIAGVVRGGVNAATAQPERQVGPAAMIAIDDEDLRWLTGFWSAWARAARARRWAGEPGVRRTSRGLVQAGAVTWPGSGRGRVALLSRFGIPAGSPWVPAEACGCAAIQTSARWPRTLLGRPCREKFETVSCGLHDASAQGRDSRRLRGGWRCVCYQHAGVAAVPPPVPPHAGRPGRRWLPDVS